MTVAAAVRPASARGRSAGAPAVRPVGVARWSVALLVVLTAFAIIVLFEVAQYSDAALWNLASLDVSAVPYRRPLYVRSSSGEVRSE